MREKLVLIDGHSILNRAFYGMPDLTNAKGVHTGAVYGFLNILFHFLDEEKATYLTVAFDVSAPTFRHKMYDAYKGTRKPMPQELKEQVPLIKDVLHAMGIQTIEQAGLEADDILGTLAKKSEAEGLEVSLISGDRDLLQISDEHIRIRIPKTKKGETHVEDYYPADVVAAYEVTPKEFIEVKALQGDTADNIPGVPKVGPKTATELIVKYHSVDGVYEHLSEITKKGLHDTLEANEDLARLSLKLATIKTDCDLDLDREKARIGNFYTPQAYQVFTELGFKNFLSRFDAADTKSAVATSKALKKTMITTKEELSGLQNKAEEALHSGKSVSVFPVFDAPDLTGKTTLLGLAAALSPLDTYYVRIQNRKGETAGQLAFDFEGGGAVVEQKKDPTPVSELSEEDGERFLSDLRLLLKAKNPEAFDMTSHHGVQHRPFAEAMLVTFDVKPAWPFYRVTDRELASGLHLEGIFDLLLGVYLCNPLKNDYTPEDIASEYLSETIEGRKQLLGKESFAQRLLEDENAVSDYAVRCAGALLAAAPMVREKLENMAMWDLYTDVELPLSYILSDMQRLGMRILPDELKNYGDQLTGRIAELEAKIYEEAGEEFNIASPKQLGEVLFDHLHLPGAKKTKSGYSTAADVLEKLSADYPIVANVLEYRGLTKLKSTYADGLSAYIAPDQRIHTTFNQTVTATGRISSADPNLQNIPMRTEQGRAIRKVFLPMEGYTFTDSDYSQIELRILASMSGDPALIEAYNQGSDIHTITAARVFGVDPSEVTPQMRRDAKAVNFGIVYGISDFGLSRDLHISRKEAAGYIDEYFTRYPGVKAFMDKVVAEAHETGAGTTMYGRRRELPAIHSKNFNQRSLAERMAMNTPIQGTAADIIKLAMIRADCMLRAAHVKSRILLQVHDELVLEVVNEEIPQVTKILKDAMEHAAEISVPLAIDVNVGKNWAEAK